MGRARARRLRQLGRMPATGQWLSRRPIQILPKCRRCRGCLSRQALRPARHNAKHSLPYLRQYSGKADSICASCAPRHTARRDSRRRRLLCQSRPDGISRCSRGYRRRTLPRRRKDSAVGHQQHCRVSGVDTCGGYAQKNGDTTTPIYTDSKNALAWLRRGASRTTLAREPKTEATLEMLRRADLWLAQNKIVNPILKWNTERMGPKYPADFGRK